MGKQGRPTELPFAREAANWAVTEIEKLPGMRAAWIAGSVRREKEICRDVDIVIDAPGVTDLSGFDGTYGLRWTPKGGYGDWMDSNVRVELYLAPEGCVAATLLYCTGPGHLNVYMRRRAQSNGMKLSQYGLTMMNASSNLVTEFDDPFESERLYFEQLKMPWIDARDRDRWKEVIRESNWPE